MLWPGIEPGLSSERPVVKLLALDLMDAIALCDITKAYTDIYVNTQQVGCFEYVGEEKD